MEQKIDKASKNLKTFWPLVIIFTVAALLGGVILGTAYSNIIQDEIYSLNFNFKRIESEKTKQPTTQQKIQKN